MNPIFHMHVPKTGGTYINNAFQEALGVEAALCHFSWSRDLSGDIRDGVVFFSSHLPLIDFLNLGVSPAPHFRIIASFREPVRQLASHLLWLDHYRDSGNEASFDALPVEIQEEILKLEATDFTNAKSIAHYLQTLAPMGVSLFDNVQTRYLSRSVYGEFKAPIDSRDLEVALGNFDYFDMCLLQSSLNDDLLKLGEMLNLPLENGDRKNISLNRRTIDLNNPEIVSSLSENTKYDDILYENIIRRRAES